MTEIDLIDGLADEVRYALRDFRLRSSKENLIPINVYTQNLPLKKERGDERQFPYVLICFDEEYIEAKTSPMIVNVYFVIGVIDKEEDNQGYRDVLQIANLIYQHIFRKGIIAKAFRPSYPFKIMLQQDDIHPYYIGGIESVWELHVIEEEDKLI